MGEEGRRERNIDSLPGSLAEALDVMDADPLIRDALGDHIYDHLLAARPRNTTSTASRSPNGSASATCRFSNHQGECHPPLRQTEHLLEKRVAG